MHAHGQVSPADHAYAHDKVMHLVGLVAGPVLYAKVDLVQHADPAREQPAFAKAELDVNGRLVRAHATDRTLRAAIDGLEARLRQRIERVGHLESASHLRHRDGGSWRHGDAPTLQQAYFPRPVEEREILRRKTFALGELTPEDAAVELERLDHNFYLFHNAETGQDNVMRRVVEGGYELLEPDPYSSLDEDSGAIVSSPVQPSVMTTEDAIELLDLGEEPFVFFFDTVSRRGRVVYRRYDGHYGLITTDEPSA